MTDSANSETTGTATRLLRGGTVLTSDPNVPDLLGGDVLISDGKVAAVEAARYMLELTAYRG